MKLILDAGNSFLKYAFFEGDTMRENGIIHYENIKDSVNTWNFSSVELVAFCTVNNVFSVEVLPFLQTVLKQVKFVEVTSKSVFPFKIKYETPDTLGVDRVAACAGAFSIQGNPGFLVIDIGTCITYDLVNKNSEYVGGAISPGLQMRLSAMHHYTAQLPLIKNVTQFSSIVGKNTRECMSSGVINGMIFEIQGFINNIIQQEGKINIYLTGGDSEFFVNALKSSIFAEPLLNLKGINELIKLNA